jgi:hypothetical protein
MRTRIVDALRGLTAAGALLAAVVHLDLYMDGFSDIATIGPLFLLDVVAGLVLGVAVCVWRHWLPVFLAAGFGAVTVIGYWISVVHGLFGVKEVISGWPEILAQIAEYVAALCGGAAAAMLWRERTPRQVRMPQPERVPRTIP